LQFIKSLPGAHSVSVARVRGRVRRKRTLVVIEFRGEPDKIGHQKTLIRNPASGVVRVWSPIQSELIQIGGIDDVIRVQFELGAHAASGDGFREQVGITKAQRTIALSECRFGGNED
jgi:hypothetical protein